MGFVKVFAYKGIVGIDARELPIEEMEIDAREQRQLGCVVELSKCQFTQEAISCLMQVKQSADDIGDVDVFSAGNVNIFCWLGGLLRPVFKDHEGSRTYTYSILESVVPVEIEPDSEFVEYIDGMSAEELAENAFNI